MNAPPPRDGSGPTGDAAEVNGHRGPPVDSPLSTSAAHFDEVANTWIRRYAERPSFRLRLVAVGAVIRETLSEYDGPAVLDFGGGPGIFSLVASELAQSVLCLDPSAGMIRAGATHESTIVSLLRSKGHHPRPERVHRVTGAIDALDRESAAFDVVLAIAVLEYVADPRRIVMEIAKHMRPGARLVLTVPNERSWFRRVENVAGSMGAGIGAVVRSERLRSRAYLSARPHGNRVAWWDGAGDGRLVLERLTPLALASSGLRALVRPTHIVVLRKQR